MTAEELKRRRRALGLTQSELAEQLGVSSQTISNIENDVYPPQNPTMLDLALSYLEMTLKKPRKQISNLQQIRDEQMRRWQSRGEK